MPTRLGIAHATARYFQPVEKLFMVPQRRSGRTLSRLYRNGPFVPGKPEQGYQLSLTPREFFAAGIKAANAWTRRAYGKDFDRLAGAEREAALKTMEVGKAEFAEINGKQFFEALLQSAFIQFDGSFLSGSGSTSPIRSTAATATRWRGGWWDIPACRRPMPTRRWSIAARRSRSSRRASGIFRRAGRNCGPALAPARLSREGPDHSEEIGMPGQARP
jgi:gluconate 2-dehydrogenase subunit 3-like protein